MNPSELAITVAALASLLSDCLPDDQLELVTVLLSQTAASLNTILLQKARIAEQQNNGTDAVPVIL